MSLTVADRLSPEDCPVDLRLSRGPDDDAAGFSSRRAREMLMQVVSESPVSSRVARAVLSSEQAQFWQIVAVRAVPKGQASIRAPLASLVFIADGTVLDTQSAALVGRTDTTLARFEFEFELSFFRLEVARWLSNLLPLPTDDATDAERLAFVKSKVEALITSLQMHVLENQQLHEQLDESALVITQLRAQVETLEAELRRKQLDTRRVGFSNSIIATVMLTALASVGGGYASNLPTQQALRADLRAVQRACDALTTAVENHHGDENVWQSATPPGSLSK